MRLERIRRIDQKIDEQAEFVRWWDEGVGVNKGGNRGNQYCEAKTPIRVFGKDEAESLTGITQQQVSKWRKALRDCRGPCRLPALRVIASPVFL